MSVAGSQAPPQGEGQGQGGLPLPKWALWLVLPGVLAPLSIFAFIVVTEVAHDEARCPFAEVSRRAANDDVTIVEEARRCMDNVEERRFLALRQGQSQLLGERRFAPSAFSPEVYRWEIAQSDAGEVHVRVIHEQHGEVVFREGTEAERRERAERAAQKAAKP